MASYGAKTKSNAKSKKRSGNRPAPKSGRKRVRKSLEPGVLTRPRSTRKVPERPFRALASLRPDASRKSKQSKWIPRPEPDLEPDLESYDDMGFGLSEVRSGPGHRLKAKSKTRAPRAASKRAASKTEGSRASKSATSKTRAKSKARKHVESRNTASVRSMKSRASARAARGPSIAMTPQKRKKVASKR